MFNRQTRAFLKVSFFGPFYGSYIVFELDHENYQYSLVSGPDISYLWILARTPEIEKVLLGTLIAKAAILGFDTEQIDIRGTSISISRETRFSDITHSG